MRDRNVLPDWLIVGTIVACLLGIGGLGYIVAGEIVDDPGPTSPTVAAPTVASPTTPSPTPGEPTPTEEEPERTLTVSVFNQTNVTGLARNTLARAVGLGWPGGTSGNWAGGVTENTVFYPEGGEAQAELLAEDLGIAQTAPIQVGMDTASLTVIMAGPQ